jgi:hypothetical protein
VSKVLQVKPHNSSIIKKYNMIDLNLLGDNTNFGFYIISPKEAIQIFTSVGQISQIVKTIIKFTLTCRSPYAIRPTMTSSFSPQ